MVKFILFSLLISSASLTHSEVLVDPSKPLNFSVKKAVKVSQPSLPTLQSILVKAGKQQAMLNNKLYQQGQSVNGYKITKIDAQKVLLSYQNKQYKLTLYSANERFSQ
ncbi:hypothetical protein ACLKMH_06125 [Psychromonas sp. KJ10-10]|uniref:hypothetical protein n=1 Tax=Psychromonas sp. KJ10-10 TaxID=3391823 RepID=UPI0039B38708